MLLFLEQKAQSPHSLIVPSVCPSTSIERQRRANDGQCGASPGILTPRYAVARFTFTYALHSR